MAYSVSEVSLLVSWCFDASRPLEIISGLKETLIRRSIVERTNKAEIRLEEQSENTEICRENLLNESLKGHKDRNRHENRIRSGPARSAYVRHKS